MSLIVTGTDTDVGKTVVSAILLARYGSLRHPVGYWKPIATGCDPAAASPSDRDTVRGWVGSAVPMVESVYPFAPPVSPHLAARQAGTVIEPDTLLAAWRRWQKTGRALVIEGIGGVLVPLDDRGTLLVDLFAALRLPCLVVARTAVGTINHTLLTLEALRARGVPIAGLVMNGPPNHDNHAAIWQLGDIDLMLDLPSIDPLDATGIRTAATRFDPDGGLAQHLVS